MINSVRKDRLQAPFVLARAPLSNLRSGTLVLAHSVTPSIRFSSQPENSTKVCGIRAVQLQSPAAVCTRFDQKPTGLRTEDSPPIICHTRDRSTNPYDGVRSH